MKNGPQRSQEILIEIRSIFQELHAHLNGSLSDKTIMNLISIRHNTTVLNSSALDDVIIKAGEKRTLEQ